MRVRLSGDLQAGKFAAQLLRLGNGNILANEKGEIEFPDECGSVVSNYGDLLSKVYPNIQQHYIGYVKEVLWLQEMK